MTENTVLETDYKKMTAKAYVELALLAVFFVVAAVPVNELVIYLYSKTGTLYSFLMAFVCFMLCLVFICAAWFTKKLTRYITKGLPFHAKKILAAAFLTVKSSLQAPVVRTAAFRRETLLTLALFAVTMVLVSLPLFYLKGLNVITAAGLFVFAVALIILMAFNAGAREDFIKAEILNGFLAVLAGFCAFMPLLVLKNSLLFTGFMLPEYAGTVLYLVFWHIIVIGAFCLSTAVVVWALKRGVSVAFVKEKITPVNFSVFALCVNGLEFAAALYLALLFLGGAYAMPGVHGFSPVFWLVLKAFAIIMLMEFIIVRFNAALSKVPVGLVYKPVLLACLSLLLLAGGTLILC